MDLCTTDVNLAEAKIECEKLATKYDFYSSFHVKILVNSVVFHDAIDGLMSGSVWPSGLLVHQFFNAKKKTNDGEEQQFVNLYV